MSVKIIKKTLTDEFFQFNAMAFIAKNASNKTWALFTHGYTASKSDCISWAQRLSDAGINSCIFDLPGHHLGSYNEVPSFEAFKENAHKCFLEAHKFLKDVTHTDCENLIIGGHSLGALLSLKAIELSQFKDKNKIAICVGYGLNQSAKTHIFDTPIYKKTISIRRQLVCENIDSDLIFPWIKEHKESIDVSDKRIHLICGLDDVVVGTGGMNYLEELLTSKGNNVTSIEPKRLPHNNPELAASFIYSFLKKELSFS